MKPDWSHRRRRALGVGYPPHFSPMVATRKTLGAEALLAPRYPVVKEWAYAGMFFDFSGAIAAHASSGDRAVSYIGPVLSMGGLFVLVSQTSIEAR